MEHTRVPKSAAERGRKGDWTGGGSDGCIRVYLVAKGSEVLALSPAAMPAASHTRVLHMLRLLGWAFEGGAFGGGIRDSDVCDEGSGYHLVRSVDQMRVTQFTSIISAHI